MDEYALRERLDAIERRQTLILWLLAGGYLFGALWALVTEVEAVTVWNAGLAVVALAVVAAAVATYRRRAARQ